MKFLRVFETKKRDIVVDGKVIMTLIDRARPDDGYVLNIIESDKQLRVYSKRGHPVQVFARGITLQDACDAVSSTQRTVAARKTQRKRRHARRYRKQSAKDISSKEEKRAKEEKS